ncbi:MAG TPA: cytochrome-c peroxidase [Bacteroidetes bacterium]|nr:cytochrome-c peroxidase [Bacteroidota bacterium]
MIYKYTIALSSLCILLSLQSLEVVQLEYPDYFPDPNYNFDRNPLAKEKIELGRYLFYDPILSQDNSISCASCHSPYNAFSHTDHDLSHGINDQIGTRNAPALFNLAWQRSFMWDGAVNHLDMQPLAPISHPKEMNENINNVVAKLQNSELYPNLFFRAFGDSIITGENALKAIAQFQLTLISANSKYDQVKKGSAKFTDQESSGYILFSNNCRSCHSEPLFSSYDFAGNGLPVDTSLNDYGKWMITKNSKDSLLFKIPSLRNLSYTFPYMHDGRFKKLRQVLNHYTSDLSQSKALSEKLKNPVILSSNEKADLIAFLLTLNDEKFIFDTENKFPKDLLNYDKND